MLIVSMSLAVSPALVGGGCCSTEKKEIKVTPLDTRYNGLLSTAKKAQTQKIISAQIAAITRNAAIEFDLDAPRFTADQKRLIAATAINYDRWRTGKLTVHHQRTFKGFMDATGNNILLTMTGAHRKRIQNPLRETIEFTILQLKNPNGTANTKVNY